MPASSRRPGPGEFELLAKVRAAVEAHGRGRGVVVGIGDDCAVVSPGFRPLLLTTDTMVDGVHFERAWLAPKELGLRAFRAAVSDIAAMGARPLWALLSLEIPADSLGEREALALVKAVSAGARRSGAALVGGNVSGGPRLAVTVTVVGEAAGKPLLRSAAKAGDLLLVTGALGGAAAGWRTLASKRSASRADSAAWRVPPSRLEFSAALAEKGLVHAMIDVSDGLLQDLGHVADESGVTIRVDASKVPVHRAARILEKRGGPPALELALSGGEDYELAFTAPSSALAAIERVAKAQRTPLSVIGVIAKGKAVVTDATGRPFALAEAGFDHLRAAAKRGARAKTAAKGKR